MNRPLNSFSDIAMSWPKGLPVIAVPTASPMTATPSRMLSAFAQEITFGNVRIMAGDVVVVMSPSPAHGAQHVLLGDPDLFQPVIGKRPVLF